MTMAKTPGSPRFSADGADTLTGDDKGDIILAQGGTTWWWARGATTPSTAGWAGQLTPWTDAGGVRSGGWAGKGDDVLHGGDGDDDMNGNIGADTVSGDAGNDQLHGGQGDDVLLGGVGDDWLSGDRATTPCPAGPAPTRSTSSPAAKTTW